MCSWARGQQEVRCFPSAPAHPGRSPSLLSRSCGDTKVIRTAKQSHRHSIKAARESGKQLNGGIALRISMCSTNPRLISAALRIRLRLAEPQSSHQQNGDNDNCFQRGSEGSKGSHAHTKSRVGHTGRNTSGLFSLCGRTAVAVVTLLGTPW